MNGIVVALFLLVVLTSTQVVDQPYYEELLISDGSAGGILNQSRYSKIKMSKPIILFPEVYKYIFSQFVFGRYYAVMGPLQPAPEDMWIDQCTHGLINGINSTRYSNPEISTIMKNHWDSGTFCEAYLCNNSTGIQNYFYRTATNTRGDAQFPPFVIHLSLVSMCMMCNNTRSNTGFISLANSNPGACNISTSLSESNFHQSVCQTNKCGDPSKSVCVLSHIRGLCYDFAERRYYGAKDTNHVVIRLYHYWGNVVALIVFLPLFLFSVFLVFVPTVLYTIYELRRLQNEMIENRALTYLRKIFSLYNQSIVYLMISEGICVLFALIDFGSFYKLYPIALFVNFFFIMCSFICITFMMVHGTDTSRAMADLPLAPKWIALLILSWIVLIIYTFIGIILYPIYSFGDPLTTKYPLGIWYFGVVLVFTVVGITLFIVLTVLYRLTLINDDDSAWKKFVQFMQIPYMGTSIALNISFVLVDIIMIITGIQLIGTGEGETSIGITGLNFVLPFIYIPVFGWFNIISNIGLFNINIFRKFCSRQSS